jgi:hypothetical protein
MRGERGGGRTGGLRGDELDVGVGGVGRGVVGGDVDAWVDDGGVDADGGKVRAEDGGGELGVGEDDVGLACKWLSVSLEGW